MIHKVEVMFQSFKPNVHTIQTATNSIEAFVNSDHTKVDIVEFRFNRRDVRL